ncbi:hypothetical protein ILP97_10640 [Amycolatopsis sp. H6(2020)]|nr:hypothetical protein [Amycolatopsis sp. H6(2020)]
MTNEIFGELVGNPPPIPPRPAHLRVTAAQVRARLAAKSPGELDQLVESAREVHDRITAAPHVLRVCDFPGASDQPDTGSPQPAPSAPLTLVRSEHPAKPEAGDLTVSKILVTGGGGVGKTTFVTSSCPVSIPLPKSALDGNPREQSAVADLGKRLLAPDLALYLLGVAEPLRFDVENDSLTVDSLGVIVLVDTRRLAEAIPHLDYLRRRGLPYVVGLNTFDGIIQHKIKDVRATLAIDDDVPVKRCDARDGESVLKLLITMLERAMQRWSSSQESMPPELRRVAAQLLA